MAIVATLQNPNLFSSLPSTPPPNDPSTASRPPPKPPIPIPKYPPPLKSRNYSPQPPTPTLTPAFKTLHRRTNYYKPVKEGVVSTDGERAVIVGESGVSYLLPGAPFEFQFSYSETPKVKPVAIREPAFLPFAPPTMPRPWTGKAPLKSKKEKRKIHLFDSLSPAPAGMDNTKVLEMRRAYSLGNFPAELKPRKSVIGPPLTKVEIKELLKPHISSNRQVNLGRDGLTHNMLELVHTHWKRRPVCKVRCLGVPTLDMDNVCRCLEEKTGGKIIHRHGGIIYIFRGRNYDPYTRPRYPVMLWKPATPVYPKLIQEVPEGLTKAEADKLRKKGKSLLPICKLGLWVRELETLQTRFMLDLYMSWCLECDDNNDFIWPPNLIRLRCLFDHLTVSDDPLTSTKWPLVLRDAKNGVYVSLVRDVRNAFEGSLLVKINCKGLHPTDYKKIGAKLKELVPCILLSFDDEQILMWRGQGWKSMFPESPTFADSADGSNYSGKYHDDGCQSSEPKPVTSSPKMMSLWSRAIDTSRAMLLADTGLGPDQLLKVVEEFEGLSQVSEHSYPALIVSREDDDNEDNGDYENYSSDDDDGHADSGEYENDSYDDVSDYNDDGDGDEYSSSLPLGSLPVDFIVNQQKDG